MKPITHPLAIILFLLTFFGCQDYTPYWGGYNPSGELKPESEYFSFNTIEEVDFSIDYGKKGSRALIEVYTENPAYIDEDGNIHYNDDAVFKAFCDKHGRYNGKITLPTYVNKVWVYTMRAGVPQIVTANVNDGEVEIDATFDGTYTQKYDDTNPGYDPEYAREHPFEVIAETTENDTTLRIWKAPTKPNATEAYPEKIYTTMNWAGQRFGRIIPTHYYDTKYNRYDLVNTEGTFDNQGLIDNGADIVGGDGNAFGTDDIDIIQHFMWNNNTTKPKNLNNTKYQMGTTAKDINIDIPSRFVKDGKLQIVDKVQVWMRFLGEGAWYCDGLGYYYYPTDNPPASPADVKAYYVTIPNTSSTAPYIGPNTEGQTKPDQTPDELFLGRTVPFVTCVNDLGISSNDFDENGRWFKSGNENYTFNPKYVPFDINQRVQLLYHEPNEDGKGGTVSKYFPSGITIGFFLFYSKNTGRNDGTTEDFSGPDKQTMYVNNSNPFLYSDWNVGNYVALNYNDKVVYGVEDSNSDKSLEDVLFTIETNPIGLLVNDDRFTIGKDFTSTTTDHRTYAFEDIWPDGGDYDMNDVVIDHHHKMTFQRSQNDDDDIKTDKIIEIMDEFTAIQPDNAATYRDAFGIQIPREQLGIEEEMSLYVNEIKEENRLNINDYMEEDEYGRNFIIFKNIMQEQYKTMILVRKFTDEHNLTIGTTTLEQEDKTIGMRNVLNPFIISQYNGKMESEGRTEIHLPKHSPTDYADKTKTGTGRDAYYTDIYGLYPFAVSLPKSAFQNQWGRHFTERNGEGNVIGNAYEGYNDWAISKGERSKDWYLNYKGDTPK